MAQYALFHLQGDHVTSDMQCVSCALSSDPRLRTNCMDGSGDPNPTFLFVGVNPGEEDDGIGKPMTGQGGRVFWELLQESGFSIRDVFVTNAVKCCGFGADIRKSHWNACRHHLVNEIARLRPQVVVAVGAKAVEWLTGHTGVDRLRRQRLSLEWDDNVPVYSIRQPMGLKHVFGEERINLRASMINDLAWLKSQVKLGLHAKRWEDACDYQTASTLEDLERMFAEIEAHPGPLSCDLETTSLDHSEGEVLAIGFSFGKGIGRAIPVKARGIRSYYWWADGVVENIIIPRVRKILQSKVVFGQNFLQFDQKWMRTHFGVNKCFVDFDTQLAHYVLHEEPPHDLESIAMEFLKVPPWKKEFSATDTSRLCTYLCKDVDVTWQLRSVLEPKLEPIQSWLLRELLIPLSHELNEMELSGVRVSEQNLNELDAFLTRRIREETDSFRSFQEVKAFEFTNGGAINLDSPDQISALFRDYFRLQKVSQTGSGGYSTDREWQEFHKSHPAVAALGKSRGLSKLKGTYCDGLQNRLKAGRIHTSFLAHRTTTGRLASRDPNLQNIPREDTAGKVLEDGNAVKKVFCADEGYALIQGDMSQAELRVLASVSGDKNLIRIYQQGLDAHTATAAAACGKSLEEVTKSERTNAKRTNFGIIYGMSLESLIAQFIEAGSTRAQAEAFLVGHKQQFPDVWRWMDDQERQVRTYRLQRTPFGRSRHYQFVDDHAVRQAYNFPIQSMASDLTLVSIIRIAHALRDNRVDAKILLTVHDSIVVQAHLDHFWRAAGIMQDIMEGVNFPWMRVPMAVDLEAGYNWGSMQSINPKLQTVG